MIKEIEVKVLPANMNDEAALRQAVLKKTGFDPKRIKGVRLIRQSIDARGARPFFLCRFEVFVDEEPTEVPRLLDAFQQVSHRPEAVIIGAGPAGYFAALELIELGVRPIIFDRGKDVRARRRDLRAIQQFGVVDPDSNYCFGEGGAGTYSDGKLYTRSHKRGNIYKALKLLVEHGADPAILIDAHPHIGSNKLPKVVANIRETILQFGGEIHFEHRLTDILIRDGRLHGVVLNGEKEFACKAMILATGHSARDIYQLLQARGVYMEAKPFALGVRIEHPQMLIDEIQYHQKVREPELPASSYRLNCQVDGRGVYSFCMCPGGLVVPAATAPGEIVVNGMSMSRRDSAYANSGTVVAIELEDIPEYHQYGALACLEFQKDVEQHIFQAGTGSQQAPAQRLNDVVNGRLSANLPATSYIPGLYSAELSGLLPKFVYERLQKGVQIFGKKMHGYYTQEANVIATESRTSAPVKIPRNSSTFMHEGVEGLFPCGEGAGYAGGIISAAMDGQNVARALAKFLQS
ncbi:MAG: FAD-binding protein [Saprospiraceae bacterium]|nr:FAD-binding protein [Saprospiraceae bacterium]